MRHQPKIKNFFKGNRAKLLLAVLAAIGISATGELSAATTEIKGPVNKLVGYFNDFFLPICMGGASWLGYQAFKGSSPLPLGSWVLGCLIYGVGTDYFSTAHAALI